MTNTLPALALPALLGFGLALALLCPAWLARARWTSREPVLGIWAWQCLVAAVVLSCVLTLLLSGAAAWPEVRRLLFSGAPQGVEAAYGYPLSRTWAMAAAFLFGVGGLRTALALAVELRTARAVRRRRRTELVRRAPALPPGLTLPRVSGPGPRAAAGEQLVVIESAEPDAWSVPGATPRLVVTTAALRRLSEREADALLAHERGHVRARHHWLLQAAEAFNAAFPSLRLFGLFRDQVGLLVELAADDSAARRHGRLATAIALVELNPAADCPSPLAQIPDRVDRLLGGRPRLRVPQRLAAGAGALALPLVPLLLALAPGLRAAA